jgi:hypothetical protein
MWIGNDVVVDTTTVRPGWEAEGEISLTAGQRYPLRVDYSKSAFWSFVQLRWKSEGLPRSVVPRCRLFHP